MKAAVDTRDDVSETLGPSDRALHGTPVPRASGLPPSCHPALGLPLRHLTLATMRRPAYTSVSTAMALMRGPRPSAALGKPRPGPCSARGIHRMTSPTL